MAIQIARWSRDRRASEVIILEIGQVSHITDYFVIMHASNRILTTALADNIIAASKSTWQMHLPHSEGKEGDWLLLDFGAVVVHIFLEETRRFYDLERLWVDAPLLHWEDLPE